MRTNLLEIRCKFMRESVSFESSLVSLLQNIFSFTHFRLDSCKNDKPLKNWSPWPKVNFFFIIISQTYLLNFFLVIGIFMFRGTYTKVLQFLQRNKTVKTGFQFLRVSLNYSSFHAS